MQLVTNLQQIAAAEIALQNENSHFITHLRQLPDAVLDQQVHSLNEQIEPLINCTECGNCCKTLMINVTEAECERVSTHLQQTTAAFKSTYIEISQEGTTMVMNQMPCHFLHNKCCTIYEHRFTECREFPQLHNPNFKSRTFATMMHYGRCPIVYNVMEALKVVSGFKEKVGNG